MQKLKPAHLFQQYKLYFQAFGASMSVETEKGQKPLKNSKRHEDSFLWFYFVLALFLNKLTTLSSAHILIPLFSFAFHTA